ncbi:MAG: putative glycoside hydrolase, partial [Oscillospiraceae bacterium]
CTDDLLAQRYPAAALTLPGGTPYSDEDGYWVDPYNATVTQYLTELCRELAGYGFDELLFKNLAMPQTDAALNYTVKLSSLPTPTSAVCGLAMDLTTANTDVLCSVILDTTSLRNGLSAQSGQNLSVRQATAYASAGTIGGDGGPQQRGLLDVRRRPRAALHPHPGLPGHHRHLCKLGIPRA